MKNAPTLRWGFNNLKMAGGYPGIRISLDMELLILHILFGSYTKYVYLYSKFKYVYMKKVIDMKAIQEMYDITENGEVYSHIRKRWLKPQLNSCEYVFYHLKPCGWVFAHTLVALKYIGPPPSPKYEINHKDSNRMNNYYKNLEWVTHSQNHLLAYENGKEHYWLGKHRPSPTLETKLLMANAKKKRIDVNGVIYESIQEASDILHLNRRTISKMVSGLKSPKHGTARVIEE